jgi:hypothetical protein
MKTILFSAPYMIPFLPRFRPLLESYGMELIVPEVLMPDSSTAPSAATINTPRALWQPAPPG